MGTVRLLSWFLNLIGVKSALQKSNGLFIMLHSFVCYHRLTLTLRAVLIPAVLQAPWNDADL